MLNRDELPPVVWKYTYQIGFYLFARKVKRGGSPKHWPECEKWGKPEDPGDETRCGCPHYSAVIIWRDVPRQKFLKRYYRFVSYGSHPEDILAVFHAADVQRFGRTVFRAIPA